MRNGTRTSTDRYLWKAKCGLLPITFIMLSGCSAPDTAVDGLPLIGTVSALASPAAPGSGEPSLHASAAGGVLMSWIEPGDTAHALRFAKLTGGEWDEPRTIAESSIFFVNWADFPSIVELGDGRLAAHWLRRSGPGTYSYDVWIAFSDDEGETWSEPVRPHGDGTLTEHGFVSLFEANGAPAAVWLDGRETADRERDRELRAMTLRFTTFDAAGAPAADALIDGRICDCCQTSVAIAQSGPVVVYRDRSTDEIRDISIVRLVNGEWSEPARVHSDEWHIEGCPVNGPAVAATGNRVAVAWFTAAQDTARVRIAFSNDSGQTFDEPVRVDSGSPVGRVDLILLDQSHALVSWLERTDAGALVYAKVVAADGTAGEPIEIGGSSAERASGFPRMTRDGDRVVFAWTEPGENAMIRIASLAILEP